DTSPHRSPVIDNNYYEEEEEEEMEQSEDQIAFFKAICSWVTLFEKFRSSKMKNIPTKEV
ncbi:4537_t:CDS:2, partial [Entrophospora sp. SA101]